MSQPETPPETSPEESQFITKKVRKMPLYERLAWLMWIVALVVLLEYALASRQEREWQAATIAGALFIVLLVGGIITGIIRRIEAEEHDKYH